MPVAAEFEEKEYEIPLAMELMAAPGQIWTPGQVLEEHLGWEAAVTASATYWRHVGRRSKPGVTLQGTLLGLPAAQRPLSKHGGAPSFRANLFVQAKRCTRYVRGPMKLTSSLKAGHPRPDPGKTIRAFDVYVKPYRFARPRQQQERLERLHYRVQRGGAKADVCYAAPVFDDRVSLWSAVRQGRVVVQSTFPRAILLKKPHRKWAYTDPGARGWKCSEAEYVEEPPLWDRVAALAEEDAAVEASAWPDELLRLAQGLYDALLQDQEEEVFPEGFGREPTSTRARLRATFNTLPTLESPAVVAWAAAAAAAHGILWLVIGPERCGLR